MNAGDDKFDVSRQKIIMNHFSGDATTDLQHFNEMTLEIMPYALTWMAGGGLTFLYDFLKIMTLLFESGACCQTNSGDFSAGGVKTEDVV